MTIKDPNPVRTRKQYVSQWKKDKYRRGKYPYMTATWCPWATRDECQDAGGFITSPWRGVLHTTEGDSYAAARSAYNAGVAPHFTVSFEGGVFKAWQHISIDRAARALMHPAGTIDTNRLRCIQIEIVAHAASAGALPHPYLDGLGKLMRWIESNTGIPRTCGVQFHNAGEGITLAVTNSPIRLSPQAWQNYSGWLGHQHVPVNDHWDPGPIDINYLLGVNVGVKPMIDPPLDIHQAVHIRKDKYTPDGVYVLQSDGAVFAFGTAVYYKGLNGNPNFVNRQAAALLWPEEAAQVHPDMGNFAQYKYVIQDTANELYGCPW